MLQIIPWITYATVCIGVLLQPAPRHLEDVAFDKQRNRLIMYGGAVMENGILNEFTNVYEWNDTGWKEYNAPGPGGRNGCALVYDEAEKATFLIGGNTEKQKPYVIHLDVWRWNGKDWLLINQTCPVKEPQAVYDPVSRRILVYGDVSDKTRFMYGKDQMFELWEYKANKWNKLSANGPHLDGPYDIAYDIKRQSLIIPDWEEGKSVVWEWKNNAWRKISCTTDCPSARNRYPLVYHAGEKVTYLFGGFTKDRQQLGDFWKWNGTKWAKITSQRAPSKRNSAHFAYANEYLLLFGGSIPLPGSAGKITVCNELWQWKEGIWKQLH